MVTVEEEVEEAPKSRFFYEEEKDTERVKIFIESLEESSRGCIDITVIFAKWRSVPLPIVLSDLSVTYILNGLSMQVLNESLRSTKANPVPDDTEERDGMDSLKQINLFAENFFNEEVTEEEREIIAQRVALQQKQFAAYEKRETLRKSRKIRKMFDYVCDEEILELLKQCDENEVRATDILFAVIYDEVIYCLTKPNYLSDIRKTIALKYAKEEESYVPLMTPEQRTAYKQLIKKRSVTLKKTTNDQAKKQYRMCGRLGLDEALEQFQNNQVDPEKAFEGWSQARIKAYQMIDQNPNSYYYRFNAPGEIQRKGQWDETINDPNYVLDERGKAHYLFDKKNADGQIQKAFRTHTKHSSNSDNMDESGPSTAAPPPPPPPPSPPRRVKREPKPKEVKPKVEAPAEVIESSTKGKGRRVVSRAGTRRRRRARYDGSDSGDDSTLYDDDFSGNYTIRASREEDENGQRKSKRARRATSISTINSDSIENNAWHQNDDKEVDPLCPLPGFIDPITLEQIIKPAISKYGHVMGYDSWTRCLNNWEGKKNICPLTKKALTKRDLVVLTLDNMEEYKLRQNRCVRFLFVNGGIWVEDLD
ncbi:hypothetical protein MFLAVUS_005100 [Mucor flavus]|uniref:Uncharacterized protein n=1 Tax=Mucor flavus TaxID=439312 RepID=A0ABP9YXS8_9FUNG